METKITSNDTLRFGLNITKEDIAEKVNNFWGCWLHRLLFQTGCYEADKGLEKICPVVGDSIPSVWGSIRSQDNRLECVQRE